MKAKKPKTKKKKKAVVAKVKLLPLMPPKKEKISAKDVVVLEKVFDGDKEKVLFFMAYLKFDRNATKAYKFLHPNCGDESCRVLGSRQLTKVNIQMILEGYGLGVDTYIQKIKDGLNATNIDIIDIKVKDPNSKESKLVYEKVETPNHTVQKAYHDKLGKLLGFEDNTPGVALQVNNNNNNQNIIDNINDDELDDIIS